MKKNLSEAVRNNIPQFFLTHWSHGVLKKGCKTAAARMFGVDRKTIYTLWEQSKDLMDLGLPIYLTNRKKGQIRPKYKVFDAEFFKTIALRRRTTIRRAAKALSVSPATVWRWKQSKQIRDHSSAIRTSLTTTQKLRRLTFCLQALYVDTTINKVVFKTMFYTIHIDEKWFYLTKTAQKFYLSPDEPIPHRDCQNKNYICKVMFLSVVCRPIIDLEGNILFDGKIGMYPFTEQVAAVRSSINRPAGTYVTKAVTSVTREVMRDTMINKVIPDIKAQWPLGASGIIFIQQDNARPHIIDDDPEFRAVATADGFDIHMMQQPAQSPDLNVNDLGWFRALQSIQEEYAPINVDELVSAVLGSFEELEPMKLNFVYLSLQACMVEIMKQRGHNNYSLPHMKKQTLLREGRLPTDLEVDTTLVQQCVDYCLEAGLENEMQPVIEELQKLTI